MNNLPENSLSKDFFDFKNEDPDLKRAELLDKLKPIYEEQFKDLSPNETRIAWLKRAETIALILKNIFYVWDLEKIIKHIPWKKTSEWKLTEKWIFIQNFKIYKREITKVLLTGKIDYAKIFLYWAKIDEYISKLKEEELKKAKIKENQENIKTSEVFSQVEEKLLEAKKEEINEEEKLKREERLKQEKEEREKFELNEKIWAISWRIFTLERKFEEAKWNKNDLKKLLEMIEKNDKPAFEKKFEKILKKNLEYLEKFNDFRIEVENLILQIKEELKK